MRSIIFVVLASFSSAGVLADTVFKCTDSAGRTVFSDRECGAVAEKLEFSHAENYYEKTMRESAERKSKLVELEKKIAADKVIRDRQAAEMKLRHDANCASRTAQEGLEIGMSKASLFDNDLWAYPDDSSKTTTQNGVKEYFVYKCDGYQSVRLFVTNGKLTSIHN